jgi:hypothetical protein
VKVQLAGCRALRRAGVLLVSLVVGCAGTDPTSAGPRVSLVDSIVLADPPGDPLGSHTGFFGITPAGTVIVSDISSQRVLRFDRTGAYLGAIGRAGEGPGEFRMPAEIIPLPGHAAFGVMDANRSRLLIFSDSTGNFLREVATPFQRAGSSVARDDETMVFAPLLTADAMVRWDMRSDLFTPLAQLELDVPGMQSIVMSMGVPGIGLHLADDSPYLNGEHVVLCGTVGSFVREIRNGLGQ